ncbi:hypothetical protein BDM02DRAFT_3122713 [Thelephora ganbajun]|uniref:Uncharacterized protein n=1 Tax=Thelephora ganbajun TaxID=370292 RepID=A0ACB6Z2W4_THEGA|nr:hypothetical protein BDM02DRAFT_3122713 [Thelephora ganbajun]
MDNWFQIHTFIVSYLKEFRCAVSTDGDRRLRDHYWNYITSESCKLAQISKLEGNNRLSELNRQAAAIQEELARFKVRRELVLAVAGLSDPPQRLSDERRRERKALDSTHMRLLS